MLRILRQIEPAKLAAQHRVVDDVHTYYIDFAYPRARLGVECHSRKWHGGEKINKDLARDRRLKLLGWPILCFSWDDVVFGPQNVAAEVREALNLLV